MGHIGTIIEKYRQALNISRKELSENICSEKHIYLIEKGQRAPSANMLKLLGDRLGVDFFEFLSYLDYNEPLAVWDKLRNFYTYRINLDFDSLKNISDEAEMMQDFKNEPWSFEIRLNNLYYMVFVEKKYEEAAFKLRDLLEKTENVGMSYIFSVNAYTLMTTCCLIIGDNIGAKKAALTAYDIFVKRHNIEEQEKLLTKMTINLMGAHYVNGEYDEVIKKGNEFLQVKQRLDSYGKLNFMYFFMALAYYAKEMREEANEFLKKAIYFLMFDNRPIDVGYVAMDGRFREMLDDLGKSSELIHEFRQKYNI